MLLSPLTATGALAPAHAVLIRQVLPQLVLWNLASGNNWHTDYEFVALLKLVEEEILTIEELTILLKMFTNNIGLN